MSDNASYYREINLPVDLTISENPLGCSPRIPLKGPDYGALAHYPSKSFYELSRTLEARWKLRKGELLLGAGIDGLLHEIALGMFAAGDELLVMQHGFPKLAFYASSRGTPVSYVPMTARFRIDFDAIVRATTPRTRTIFICNPNNPTGLVETAESIVRLCRKVNATVIVDEAAGEYADSTVIDHIRDLPNLIVLRSFSKVYGLASIRVGYAMGQQTALRPLAMARSRFPVSEISAQMALMALSDSEHVHQTLRATQSETRYLQKALQELGFNVIASDTNCFIAKIPVTFTDPAAFHRLLEQRGAAVVPGESFRLPPSFVRLAPRTRKMNDAFVDIVKNLRTG